MGDEKVAGRFEIASLHRCSEFLEAGIRGVDELQDRLVGYLLIDWSEVGAVLGDCGDRQKCQHKQSEHRKFHGNASIDGKTGARLARRWNRWSDSVGARGHFAVE